MMRGEVIINNNNKICLCCKCKYDHRCLVSFIHSFIHSLYGSIIHCCCLSLDMVGDT